MRSIRPTNSYHPGYTYSGCMPSAHYRSRSILNRMSIAYKTIDTETTNSHCQQKVTTSSHIPNCCDEHTISNLENFTRKRLEPIIENGRKQWQNNIVPLIEKNCKITENGWAVLIEKVDKSLITTDVLTYLSEKMPEVKICENKNHECTPVFVVGGVAAIGLCVTSFVTDSPFGILGGFVIWFMTSIYADIRGNISTYRVIYRAKSKKNN